MLLLSIRGISYNIMGMAEVKCYFYTDRFLKTDRKDPATLGMDEAIWEVPPLRDEGNSGGIELRPMSEPSIRLMM